MTDCEHGNDLGARKGKAKKVFGQKYRTADLRTTTRLALLTVLLSAPLIADEQPGSIDGIYEGIIGHHAIVLEISQPYAGEQGTNYDDPEDERTYPITGSYFYRRHGVSIQLAGLTLVDGSLRLREYRNPLFLQYVFTGEWRLRFNRGKATGIFCKCDLSGSGNPAGALLKITLRRISETLTPPESWQIYKPHAGMAYYDLLLDSPLLIGPEKEVSEAIAYRMRTDPRFNVRRPKLTRFPDARVMARINSDLDKDFTDTRLSAAADLAGGQYGSVKGGFYDETVNTNAVPPDVLAVLIESSWYSGGAHPNEGSYTLNYDLHTGKRFTLENSFRAPGGSIDEEDIATVLARLYRRHYVKPPPTAAPEDCDIVFERNTSGDISRTEAFSPRNATLFMAKNGLLIIPLFQSRPDSGCAPPITVPYRELIPYVKKGSLLRTVVERETSLHQ